MKFYLSEDLAKFKLYEAFGNGKGINDANRAQAFKDTSLAGSKSWDEAYQKAQGNASALDLLWDNYYKYEWGAEAAPRLKSLGEAIPTELMYFGFTSATNPYLDYLSRTGYLKGKGKLTGLLTAEKYSTLHNQWDKALTDDILRGRVQADSIDGIANNLIITNTLFQQNPNVIDDYLDLVRTFKSNENAIASKLDDLVKTAKLDPNCTPAKILHLLLDGYSGAYSDLTGLYTAAANANVVAPFKALRPVAQVKTWLEKILGQSIKKKEKATNQDIIDKLKGVSADDLKALAVYLMIQAAGDNITKIGDWQEDCNKIIKEQNWAEIKWDDIKVSLTSTFMTIVESLQSFEISSKTIVNPMLFTILQLLNPSSNTP